MNKSPRVLRIPPGITATDIASRLPAGYRLHTALPSPRERVFLDTVDWRLSRSGWVLEYFVDIGQNELIWHRQDDDGQQLRLAMPTLPDCAKMLPLGQLRDRLLAILKNHPIRPLAKVQCEVQKFSLSDSEDRMVLHLELEQGQILSTGGEILGITEGQLCLLPVRGYAAILEQVIEVLRGLLLPVSQNLYKSVLKALGQDSVTITHGEHNNSSLTHGVILQRSGCDLIQAIESNLKWLEWGHSSQQISGFVGDTPTPPNGVQNDVDPEHVHDLRVAIRRTRSILWLINTILPAAQTAYLKQEFAWLQQVTSRARDAHVSLSALNAYQATLPTDLRTGLAHFETYLQQQQVNSQLEMLQSLEPQRIAALLTNWRAILDTISSVPVACVSKVPINNKTVCWQKIIRGKWQRLHEQILKHGHSLTIHSPPEKFHDMRKYCKKMRYSLEFFQDVYAPELISQVLKQIKDMLGALGTYQDLVVQAHMLDDARSFIINFDDQYVLHTMDVLSQSINHRQTAAIKKFMYGFLEFSNHSELRRFKTLCHSI